MSATTLWAGYLVRSVRIYNGGTAAAHERAPFPLQYIQYNTYKANPNQREEIKAYRDDNTRNLTRVTASGKKSTIEFKTRKLHLHEKMDIQSWIGEAEENTQEAHEQRKIQLQYWDDEENQYKTGYFYIPNIEYTIVRITREDIIYGELTIKFVEY